jgi:hypothetical protein
VLLEMSALKEGAVVAVEEGTPQEEKKLSHRKEGETIHRRCKHGPRKKRKVIYC